MPSFSDFDHGVAALEKPSRQPETDAGGASGDQYDVTFELHACLRVGAARR
jgi:hypothetical protein